VRIAVKVMLFGAVILLAGCPGFAASYPYGLWVEAEGPNQTLDDLGRLEAMVRAAATLGALSGSSSSNPERRFE